MSYDELEIPEEAVHEGYYACATGRYVGFYKNRVLLMTRGYASESAAQKAAEGWTK